MENDEVKECCGWCEKFNTSECSELFVQPDSEPCENYVYGLPFNNE